MKHRIDRMPRVKAIRKILISSDKVRGKTMPLRNTTCYPTILTLICEECQWKTFTE